MARYYKVVAADPEDADAWVSLGRAAGESHSLEVARASFERAIALGRQDSGIRGELAGVLHYLGESARAVEEAKRALTLAADDHERSWAHQMLGWCFHYLGMEQAEWEHFVAAVQAWPESPEAHMALGGTCLRRGDAAGALIHLERTVALNPDDAEAWNFLAVCAKESGALQRSREAAEKAIELGRDMAAGRALLAWVLSELGEFEGAIEHGKRGLRAATGRLVVELHGILASCYGSLGDERRELTHLRQAVKADPDDHAAQYALAYAYAQRERLDRAKPYLERAVALAPEDADYRAALAQLYAAQGEFERAEPMLRQLLNSEQRGRAHLLLVHYTVERGRVDEALDQARMEVERQPESALAWAALCRALHGCGNKSGAAHALAKGRELKPDDPWVAWVAEIVGQ